MRVYPLLAAALITLSFTACDQMREKTPGEGKPGQYPPSLWEKREGSVSDEELDKAAKEAQAATPGTPLTDEQAKSFGQAVEKAPKEKAFGSEIEPKGPR